jgi:hypothetical protein
MVTDDDVTSVETRRTSDTQDFNILITFNY